MAPTAIVSTKPGFWWSQTFVKGLSNGWKNILGFLEKKLSKGRFFLMLKDQACWDGPACYRWNFSRATINRLRSNHYEIGTLLWWLRYDRFSVREIVVGWCFFPIEVFAGQAWISTSEQVSWRLFWDLANVEIPGAKMWQMSGANSKSFYKFEFKVDSLPGSRRLLNSNGFYWLLQYLRLK